MSATELQDYVAIFIPTFYEHNTICIYKIL